jgi:hypothetical protein
MRPSHGHDVKVNRVTKEQCKSVLVISIQAGKKRRAVNVTNEQRSIVMAAGQSISSQ